MNAISNEVVVVCELVADCLGEAERLVEVLELVAQVNSCVVGKDEDAVLVFNANLRFADWCEHL